MKYDGGLVSRVPFDDDDAVVLAQGVSSYSELYYAAVRFHHFDTNWDDEKDDLDEVVREQYQRAHSCDDGIFTAEDISAPWGTLELGEYHPSLKKSLWLLWLAFYYAFWSVRLWIAKQSAHRLKPGDKLTVHGGSIPSGVSEGDEFEVK